MKYENTKSGIKYLYYAALFMIISNLSFLFSSSSNTTLKTISNVLAIVGVVGYLLSLKGIRLCSKDDSGFYQAYIFATIGLIVGLVGNIIALIFKVEWIYNFTQTITNFCDFMIVWQVLFTCSYVLKKFNLESLADSAKKTSYLFLGCFIVTLLLFYYNNSNNIASTVINSGLLSILTTIIGIIGSIKYFLFLRQMKKVI